MSDEGNPVVGHKTFHSAERGFWHEPLRKSEADEMLEQIAREEANRRELMPDEDSAIKMFFRSYIRLKELGWREAIYCPKDGSEFEVIEPGSTGIHRCVYRGEWPSGGYWIVSDGDMSPSRPALFRRCRPTEIAK